MSTLSFEDQSRSFLEWFKSWPGTTFHESIEIKDLRGREAGRGIGGSFNTPISPIEAFTYP